jgi:hypothetical protein
LPPRSARGHAIDAPRDRATPRAAAARRARSPLERWLVPLLLATHVALAAWAMAKSSVMFDENLHLPAGVAIVARGDFLVSPEQPPLMKAACAIAAVAAGARVPPLHHEADYTEFDYGADFAKLNADRYARVYAAARLVALACSVLLALLVWRWARRLYGAGGGVLALAAYTLSPEAIAHAGIVGMDMPTALTFTAALYAFWRFARSGSWAWWVATALAASLALLTRFSALQLLPVLLALAVLEFWRGRARSRAKLWLGLALLPIAMLIGLQAGYLGQTSFAQLSQWTFSSAALQHAKQAWPALRLPLPDASIAGLDFLARLGAGGTPTLFLGRVSHDTYWSYAPVALLLKWPVGFLALLAARWWWGWRTPNAPRHAWHERFVILPALGFLALAMFVLKLDVGIRYLLPVLPLLSVWIGALAAPAARLPLARAREPRDWAVVGVMCAALMFAEALSAAPNDLAFFNKFAGKHPDRLVNDSAVDWGQGLVALRDELHRRGIGRVYLTYHGTTDPALYGIDYVPYRGGEFGHDSDWFAVSSYYFVGLPQRMVTPQGRTQEFLAFDLRPFWDRPPAARPAGCMYLFRLR